MKKHILTKKEKALIFLNEYFFGYSIWLSILRIIAGPILIFIGLYSKMGGFKYLGVDYTSLVLVFGIYYVIRPLFVVYRMLNDSSNYDDVEVLLEEDRMILKSSKDNQEHLYTEFDRVNKRKFYYKLKPSSKSPLTYYVPFKYMESKELEILENLIANS